MNPHNHVWEDIGNGVEKCFECDAERRYEPQPEPLLDDDLRGCPTPEPGGE